MEVYAVGCMNNTDVYFKIASKGEAISEQLIGNLIPVEEEKEETEEDAKKRRKAEKRKAAAEARKAASAAKKPRAAVLAIVPVRAQV